MLHVLSAINWKCLVARVLSKVYRSKLLEEDFRMCMLDGRYRHRYV